MKLSITLKCWGDDDDDDDDGDGSISTGINCWSYTNEEERRAKGATVKESKIDKDHLKTIGKT